MSASFQLNLDTTGPQIAIVSPQYTLPGIDTEIIIQANEEMSMAWQDIYIIDVAGTRHDLVCTLESDGYYHGIYNFADLALGLATIYARVEDDVNNLSNIAIATIHIAKGADGYVLTSDKCRVISIGSADRKLNTTDAARRLITAIRAGG